MKIKIEVQWPGKTLGEAIEYAERFGCQAEKTNTKYFYTISTDDPINLYWLGANINNEALNNLLPSAISKYVEL